jgi:hypothetical protein
MQKRTPAPESMPRADERMDRSALTFTLGEKREIFKGMVVGELEAGFLRYSRRQALLEYAQKLGIPEFEACLLIAEAQYHAGDIEPIRLDSAATLENVEKMENWSVPVKLLVALFVAVFVDLLLIYWLFV